MKMANTNSHLKKLKKIFILETWLSCNDLRRHYLFVTFIYSEDLSFNSSFHVIIICNFLYVVET